MRRRSGNLVTQWSLDLGINPCQCYHFLPLWIIHLVFFLPFRLCSYFDWLKKCCVLNLAHVTKLSREVFNHSSGTRTAKVDCQWTEKRSWWDIYVFVRQLSGRWRHVKNQLRLKFSLDNFSEILFSGLGIHHRGRQWLYLAFNTEF